MEHNFANRKCVVCKTIGQFAVAEDNSMYVCRVCFTPYGIEFPQNEAEVFGPVPPSPVPPTQTKTYNGPIVDHITRTDLMGNKHKIEVSRQYVQEEKEPPHVVFNPNSTQVEWVMYYYKDKIRNRRRYNRHLIRKNRNERNDSHT